MCRQNLVFYLLINVLHWLLSRHFLTCALHRFAGISKVLEISFIQSDIRCLLHIRVMFICGLLWLKNLLRWLKHPSDRIWNFLLVVVACFKVRVVALDVNDFVRVNWIVWYQGFADYLLDFNFVNRVIQVDLGSILIVSQVDLGFGLRRKPIISENHPLVKEVASVFLEQDLTSTGQSLRRRLQLHFPFQTPPWLWRGRSISNLRFSSRNAANNLLPDLNACLKVRMVGKASAAELVVGCWLLVGRFGELDNWFVDLA